MGRCTKIKKEIEERHRQEQLTDIEKQADKKYFQIFHNADKWVHEFKNHFDPRQAGYVYHIYHQKYCLSIPDKLSFGCTRCGVLD